MARSLDASFEAATLATLVRPILFVELAFTSGAVRVWSGLGDFTWNAATWTGAGTLMGVSSIEETEEVRSAGITLTLSGVPNVMLSLALAEPYQGRACVVHIGALNTNTNALIGSPYTVFKGKMDLMTIDEGQEESTIAVSAESRLVDLERARERRYDHHDQQIVHPGDMFFEYVPSIVEAEIVWGKSL
jgi:hypothetical protein